MLPLNLVSDLEKAIAGRSADAGAMLNQITDLFLLNVGHYTVEQLDVYDVVLKQLIAKVEVTARAMLARRIALVNKAPSNTIRSLALDDAIEVAEPILSQYNALDDDTLSRCIATKGQEHLLAIATRNKISETDNLSFSGKRQHESSGHTRQQSGCGNLRFELWEYLSKKASMMNGYQNVSPAEKTFPSITFANSYPRRRKLCDKD